MATVLVIDDEPQLLRAVQRALRADAHEVLTATGGEPGLRLASQELPDLLLLDLGLPDISGVEVIRRLREWSVIPILVLSVTGSEPMKVAALDAGADDYVTKPFGMDELRARIRAALRRAQVAQATPAVFDFGELRLDVNRRLVTRNGQRIALTPNEYQLLEAFATNPGTLLTHHWLLNRVWGRGYGDEARQYLRVYVRQLRDKLDDDASQPQFIATEAGLGYRWLPEPSAAST